MIFIGNTFTIFVFWIHRHKLKRASFLLINLAVADLLVGFTEILTVGSCSLPREIGTFNTSKTCDENISAVFQIAFSGTSIFFLVLISLERGFALIWPLRHRVTSNETYIYSAVTVWLAGATVGALSLLFLYGIFHLRYYMAAYLVIIIFCLVTICVSYMAIRTRLYQRVPGIEMAHNRQSVEQTRKLSCLSRQGLPLAFTFQVLRFAFAYYYLPSGYFPMYFYYIFTTLYQTNSLVNPVIYSLRMPVFGETLKSLKNNLRISGQSEKYSVNARP